MQNMNNSLRSTMSRRQLFEVGDTQWMTGLEKDKAEIIQKTYDELQTTEQYKHFWEEFDYYCSTDILSLMVYTELLVKNP